MAEREDKKDEDKVEFDSAGQAIGYISMDQARVLAIEHARENTDFYGRRYLGIELYWEVVSQEESEDYYDIQLSYRPVRDFRGSPGLEQFTFDKAGPIRVRQIVREPAERRGRRLPVIAIGLVAIAAMAVVVAVLLSRDEAPISEVPATSQTATPAAAIVVATSLPVPPTPMAIAPVGTATPTGIPPAIGTPATTPTTPIALAGLPGRVAFAGSKGTIPEIWVINADGTNETRLTFHSLPPERKYATSPAWSPDGTKIAYAYALSDEKEIYVMNSDGTDPTPLTRNYPYQAAWTQVTHHPRREPS